MKIRLLSMVMFAAALVALSGCPKQGGAASSGDSAQAGTSWVVFEVLQAGTGNGLFAQVWPRGMDDDFDSISQGQAGAETRFEGIGRREGGGYALPFQPGKTVELRLWSPGHEPQTVSVKLKKGENHVLVELKRSEVGDEQVPEHIRLDADQNMPPATSVSGT